MGVNLSVLWSRDWSTWSSEAPQVSIDSFFVRIRMFCHLQDSKACGVLCLIFLSLWKLQKSYKLWARNELQQPNIRATSPISDQKTPNIIAGGPQVLEQKTPERGETLGKRQFFGNGRGVGERITWGRNGQNRVCMHIGNVKEFKTKF